MVCDEEPVMLQVREVSQVTGLSEASIRAAARDKRLKATRIGRRWLIPRSELDRLLRCEAA
jgi:excisionase family DNA binding protein